MLKISELELYQVYRCRLSDKIVQYTNVLEVDEATSLNDMGDIVEKKRAITHFARYFNDNTQLFEKVIIFDNQLEKI